jgi:hypothetical protein
MEGLECNSILRNPLRDLRRIEFSEIIRETSLGADSRAIWQILGDFSFYGQNAPNSTTDFYVESTRNLHGHTAFEPRPRAI